MELLPQIKTAQNPVLVVQQFAQTISEHPENVMLVVKRLIQSLRARDARQRGNMAFALCHLVRKTKKHLKASEVYELSKSTLELGTETVDLRHNTIALFMAWASISRGGLFVGHKEIILGMIRIIHGYSNASFCLRSIGYQSLYTIMESCFKSTEEFKDYAFKELSGELGTVCAPPHADSFDMWLKLYKKYQGIQLKPWATSPTSSPVFRSLASVFDSTVKNLPSIHPLWYTLAKHDSMQLVKNSMDNWKNASGNTSIIPLIAIVAAFKEVDVTNFMTILNQNIEFCRKVSNSKEYYIMIDAAIVAAEKFLIVSPHRIVSISTAFCKCFTSKQISSFLAKLNDAQTLEVMSQIEHDGLPANIELLWAQLHRENIEDPSIITNLFARVSQEIIQTENKQVLLTFLSHIVDTVTSNGLSWIFLLSEDENCSQIIVIDQESLLRRVLKMVSAAHKIHEKIGINDHIINEIADIDSLLVQSHSLIQSKCEFCSALGRSIVKASLPYISFEQFKPFVSDDYLLFKSASISHLAQSTVPILLENSKTLTRSLRNLASQLRIDLNSEDAEKLISHIYETIKSNNSFISHIFVTLVGRLDLEAKTRVAKNLIKHQLAMIGKESSDFVPTFAHAGKQEADLIFDTIKENTTSEESQAVLRRYKQWLNDICTRHEFDVDEIGHLLNKMTKITLGDKRSDRKRQEEALGWLSGFIKLQKRSIPLFEMNETLKSLDNSPSKDVKTYAQFLLEQQIVQNLDEEE